MKYAWIQQHRDSFPVAAMCRGQQVRCFRNVPVGADCSWLIATLPHVACRLCRAVRQIAVGLANLGARTP